MAPLTPVYWQTISPPMHQLLRLLGQVSLLHDFYLAGGTALALRLGHRYSIDLDFFSTTNWVERPTRRIIVDMLSALQVQVLEDVDGNLLLRAWMSILVFSATDTRCWRRPMTLKALPLRR